jgi:CheY-like chemotaxis protein
MEQEMNRILIVDDDQLMRFGLSRALSRKSFEVASAATARQALMDIATCPYHLCLLSMHLPDINGLELLRIIKDNCPETVVILMAASYIGDSGLREKLKEALDQGQCLFIAKPFNLADATDLIINALEGNMQPLNGFRLTEEGYVDRRRKYQRKPFVKILNFYTSGISEGEVRRSAFRAVSTDICEGGIGLLTQIPLQENQVVSFDEELSSRLGVVAWSTMLDSETCRAGIRFT